MSEQEDATQSWRERVASMSEAELVRWTVVWEHMAAIWEVMTELAGQPLPDAEVAAIQRILAWELKKRAARKGRQP